MAEAFTTPEIGGDHFRASSVFLTQAHPKQTMGSDLYVGTSFDQIYARAVRSGHGDSVDAAVHRERSIIPAAASTTTRAPTPTRSAGRRRASRCRCCATRARCSTRCSASAPRRRNAPRRRREDKSILDTIVASIDRMKRQLGAADRARLNDYLDDVREIERRIQNVEAFNRSGETRELPDAPIGVPDSLRRARQADVRPAGGGAGVGHHARVRVQAVARRVGPRVPADRRHHRLPQRVASRRARRNGFSTSRRSTTTTSAWCRTSSSG